MQLPKLFQIQERSKGIFQDIYQWQILNICECIDIMLCYKACYSLLLSLIWPIVLHFVTVNQSCISVYFVDYSSIFWGHLLISQLSSVTWTDFWFDLAVSIWKSPRNTIKSSFWTLNLHFISFYNKHDCRVALFCFKILMRVNCLDQIWNQFMQKAWLKGTFLSSSN